jgi:hypothetical protein
MSLRAAVRGIVLAAAGAVVAVTVAAILSPSVRRVALGLAGRDAEPEPQQPTHIVLPDRDWTFDGDEAIEAGRGAGSGDIALTGS